MNTDSDAGSFRELFRVSLPLIISAGSHSVMSIADRVMLAGYSPSAESTETLDIIAAVTPAAMLHWTVACIPIGTVLYANTFISQFDGAGKTKELTASLWHAVWLAIVSGLILMLVAPFSHSLFVFAGHSESVAGQEADYFNTLCYGSVVLLVPTALSCFFSGRQQTQVVMWVNVISVVINISVGYCLIFGNFGLPEMGIRGAGVATVVARCVDISLYGILIWMVARGGDFSFAATIWPRRDLLLKYLRFGVPSGLHYFVDNSSFLVFLFIVGSLNRDAMAATNLAFSVNSLIFIPLLGFGTAVQTLVGHHIGAGLQPAATRTTWNAVRMGIVWTGAAAVLLICFPTASLQPFLMFEEASDNATGTVESVLPVAAGLLQFVAIYSVFDSMAVVFASALRGAGDTFFPMVITMCSSWLVMTLPAWLIARSDGATIDHLWMTCTAHIVFMGVAMFLRYTSGRWKEFQIVDENLELEVAAPLD